MVKNHFIYGDKKVQMVGHDDHIMSIISHYDTFYEHKMLEYIRKNIPSGAYLDIGANIGNHSVFFGLFCNAQVFAFEPEPQNLQYLETNIANNGLEEKVFIRPIIVGDGTDKKYQLTGHDPDNMGMVKAKEGGEFPNKSLDQICTVIQDIQLIKIDCEGMELDVLKGAEGILQMKKPDLFIEGDLQELSSFLKPFGYKKVRRFNHTPTYHFKHS